MYSGKLHYELCKTKKQSFAFPLMAKVGVFLGGVYFLVVAAHSVWLYMAGVIRVWKLICENTALVIFQVLKIVS